MALKPSNRLRRRSDFLRVYEQGRVAHGRSFTMFALNRGDTQDTRFGFTIVKRLGGAVVRNRLRRQLREAARQALPHIEQGLDIVINAKSDAVAAGPGEIRESLRALLRRARARAAQANSGVEKQ